jgi:hypothetical protein
MQFPRPCLKLMHIHFCPIVIETTDCLIKLLFFFFAAVCHVAPDAYQTFRFAPELSDVYTEGLYTFCYGLRLLIPICVALTMSVQAAVWTALVTIMVQSILLTREIVWYIRSLQYTVYSTPSKWVRWILGTALWIVRLGSLLESLVSYLFCTGPRVT